MSHNLAVIGIEPEELGSIRTLIQLLRHADPNVRELARQALQYLTEFASRSLPTGPRRPPPKPDPSVLPNRACPLDHAG